MSAKSNPTLNEGARVLKELACAPGQQANPTSTGPSVGRDCENEGVRMLQELVFDVAASQGANDSPQSASAQLLAGTPDPEKKRNT